MKKTKLLLASLVASFMLVATLVNPIPVKAAGETEVTIQLTDENGNQIQGTGEFTITDTVSGTEYPFTTAANGTGIALLPVGTYTVEQISLSGNTSYSANYDITDLKVVDATPMTLKVPQLVNTTYFTVFVSELDLNTATPEQLAGVKGVAGVTANFYDADKNLLFTAISDASGFFIYEGSDIIMYPIYDKTVSYVQITSVPSQYILDNAMYLLNGDRDFEDYYHVLTLKPVITPVTPTPAVTSTNTSATKTFKTPPTGDTTSILVPGIGMLIALLSLVSLKKVRIQ